MVEARLLSLVLRYPHPTALARRVRDRRVIPALRRLEARGLVTRRRGLYRLTTRGEAELGVTRAVAQLLARTRAPG
jgi:DNA-binding PadR family transcriptional regulator